MKIIIGKPSEVSTTHFKQIIELILKGRQIKLKPDQLKENLKRADFISYGIKDSNIVTTATLKNPYSSYRTRVFNEAKAKANILYQKELGYIATDPAFEGKGFCQDLLKEFSNKFGSITVFATTRKPAMIHILKKLGFKQNGNIYKEDLVLLTRS
jgi:predicted acetyltransferase